MHRQIIDPFRPIYPGPAGLVTSVSADGTPNIITLAEIFNISIAKPVIVGIAIHKARYSHELISTAREFVVNLPTTDIVAAVDRCGSASGRDVDKFAASGLTPLPADKVSAPLIAQCPVNIECRVIGIQEIGDHDLFLGEAVVVHADTAVLDGAGKVVAERLRTLVYQQGEYWSAGTKLGQHGFTRG